MHDLRKKSVVFPALRSESVKDFDRPVNTFNSAENAATHPLDWLLNPGKSVTYVDRVIAHLVRAEAHEPDVFLRDDLRVAQSILLHLRRGEVEDVLNKATRAVLKCRADQVWPNIVANRKIRLGAEYYDWYDSNDNPRADIPKLDQIWSRIVARRQVALGRDVPPTMRPKASGASFTRLDPKRAPLAPPQNEKRRA